MVEPTPPSEDEHKPPTEEDLRMYLPHPEGWTAHLKQSWEKQYCYAKNPGEDHFHLILNGEIYLQRGNEVYCLNCAFRQEILTRNRGFWQKST